MNERQIILHDGLAHSFVFAESAIRHASVVNYTFDKDVLINIFIRSRGGRRSFVVNSKSEGHWGEELILPIADPAAPDARIRLLFEGGAVKVQQEGGEPVIFRPDRQLPGSMKLIFPSSIQLHENAPVGGAEAIKAKDASKPKLPEKAEAKKAEPKPKPVPSAAAPVAEASPPAPVESHGFVDFQGCLGDAGIWVAAGWTKDFTAESDIGRMTQLRMAFADGELVGPAVVCWHERPDLKGAGVGFLVVSAMPEESATPAGKFSYAEIMRDSGSPLRVVASAVTSSPPIPQLQQWTNDVLSKARGEVTTARRHLRRIYSGAETISQLPIHLEVDDVCPVEDDGAFLAGWLVDPGEAVVSIRLCAGRTRSSNLRDRWVSIARQDVKEAFQSRYDLPGNRLGFLAYANLPEAPLSDAYLEVTLRNGDVGFKPLPSRRITGVPAIRRVLSLADVAFDELDHVFGEILARPLVLLNRQRLNRPLPVTEAVFGTPPRKPRCSVVVPLYGRLDFVTYQTALFSAGGLEQDELIYVLDEPEKKQTLFELAHSAYERFQVPFRLVFPAENRGFGPACNLGLQHAKGEFVCFLNSDIFPRERSWLNHLVADLREDPTIGIAGALLLFADGSVQHSGLVYEPVKQFGDWLFPLHPGKGFRPEPHADPVREVEGVTGACMVMRRELVEKLGGFDRDFIIGDFEDADLCQRIKTTGLRCVVDERAVLYHLERQSQGNQASRWRMNLTLVNAWTYGQRWNRQRQKAAA